MKHFKLIMVCFVILIAFANCNGETKANAPKDLAAHNNLNAKEILSNPEYVAMSYGGYRYADHNIEPRLEELKEDMKILSAMGVKIIRTYKVHFPQASNILKAITELKIEDPSFEMYVMLGAWINCKNAFSDEAPDHNQESEGNAIEIDKTVALAIQYPEIVKVIAVGNEAMVKWAASYFVQPNIILKWVNHLQDLKIDQKLPQDLWITSSDNFASWGGGDGLYHTDDLYKLIKAVDFISIHTYPMHDTHYNPDFWGISESSSDNSQEEKIEEAMEAAFLYAKSQYESVAGYLASMGVSKQIHIGETGWASFSNGHYGNEGSKATDEYKEAIYYEKIRSWTSANQIACFYFEAFDEIWKDAANSGGSENHFGLLTIEGKAKYALWELVDQGVFDGLTRNGAPIHKTYDGNKKALLKEVKDPPVKKNIE